jgi:cyclic pyranopterin phosphate synthase
MPKDGVKLFKKKEILTLEEIFFLVEFFHRNFGIRKIRFTGGEPLLRRGFDQLLKNIRKEISSPIISITTNGILLKEYAKLLKKYRVRVNVSLDTLDRNKFRKITGFNYLERIIDGINHSISIGIPLKINTVVLKGINDSEIFNLIDFAMERRIDIRFIEYMPVSGGNKWRSYFLPERGIIERLKNRYEILFYRSEGKEDKYLVFPKNSKVSSIGVVGFISTVSKPFCESCSRLRITSDGKMVLCLFDRVGYDLKRFLRPVINEGELLKFILDVVKLKPEGFFRFKNGESFFKSDIYINMRKLGG